MKLELISWNIVGTRPLMQSNPIIMERQEGSGLGTRTKKAQGSAYEEAKAQLYVDEDGTFFHPAISFWKALFVACPNRKIGSLAAASAVAQGVATCEENFTLLNPNSLSAKKPKPLTTKDWTHDIRRVVNKKAGALLASRPKWREWGGILTFEVDTEFFSTKIGFGPITELLNIAGRYGIGVGRMKKVEGKSEWGGMNLGKFEATLRE